MTSPLRGTLRVEHDARTGSLAADPERTRDLTELIANRVAMAVETQWLRGVDQRRRAWMTYLAETSELLGQSLDVDLTVTVVPQVVVPRLGRWCAVHLVDPAGPAAAGRAHPRRRGQAARAARRARPGRHPGPAAGAGHGAGRAGR